ncbi:MAG TPA: COX15/CtaA family protein [Rariglobus sp.]|jgi:cytochrome c oxidase assembly protein subunit 15|nr:COX15/CtaA family protein [Rariglobus sp.]
MSLLSTSSRTAAYKPALAWFAAIGGLWVFVLVMLGAFTTSIGAGMVFKGWPLSNGSLNPAGWLSDINEFAEHSHRLSAGLMSIITIALAVWIWLSDERAWLRKLAGFAVALVFFQALVGGLRVLLQRYEVEMIDTSVGRLFAMLHACLAQIYVCTLLALALSLTRAWLTPAQDAAAGAAARLRKIGIVCCSLLLVQLAVAAIMRHSFAGLAIPTFPFSTENGGLLPAVWDFRVAINFTHRVMAFVLTIALLWFAARIWLERSAGTGLKEAAGVMVGLLFLQIALGISVIWSTRDPYFTTAHVLVGACTLAMTFGITWWLHRDIIDGPAPTTRA